MCCITRQYVLYCVWWGTMWRVVCVWVGVRVVAVAVEVAVVAVVAVVSRSGGNP